MFLYHFSLTRQKELGKTGFDCGFQSHQHLLNLKQVLLWQSQLCAGWGVSPFTAPKVLSYAQIFFTSFKSALPMNTAGKTAVSFYHRLPQIQIVTFPKGRLSFLLCMRHQDTTEGSQECWGTVQERSGADGIRWALRTIDSLRLERTLKVSQSNHEHNTAKFPLQLINTGRRSGWGQARELCWSSDHSWALPRWLWRTEQCHSTTPAKLQFLCSDSLPIKQKTQKYSLQLFTSWLIFGAGDRCHQILRDMKWV